MSRPDRGRTLQDRIVDLIHEQRLPPGSVLPTEPQLMDRLGASRNSVREAVRALQALGIVEIRHGLGTFVGEAPLKVLTPSLAFHIRTRSSAPGVTALGDLVGVRELLEVGLIGSVAASISPARLVALEALAERMSEDPEADRAFHALLYESCGNDLVLQLIQLFWGVYHEVENTLEPPVDRAEEIAANHLAIVASLRTGDAEAAREAMRRHFTDVKARVEHAERLAASP
ncbi:FadR/GntR family transcriptional regulator [Streptomyces gossypii]|uniref:FadR/GntR family transcriptional regulator n=1 Tax=Streptomyces gossypii TaxID=2883101 RepID=UPI0028830571|nr:FadR/GntR family transcriptional regulator [Streptomyces gossypii]